ncbi:unnamed protein product [Debaryomyces tyrocola]|nr:unnamed protein product [Debaryomyces tyrocola]
MGQLWSFTAIRGSRRDMEGIVDFARCLALRSANKAVDLMTIVGSQTQYDVSVDTRYPYYVGPVRPESVASPILCQRARYSGNCIVVHSHWMCNAAKKLFDIFPFREI